MKKKLLFICIAMLMIIAVACSNESGGNNNGEATGTGNNGDTGGEAQEAVTLELVTNSGDIVTSAYREVARDFQDIHSHITVDVSSQGQDFESLIRTRMASGDLPDMWTTHGWSVERYSEFLRPLNDQPWADSIIDSMIPTISNDEGEIFVLAIDADQSGVVVNKTVLESAGVDPDELHSWDDFLAAFEAIKHNGDTPVGMWGQDPRSFAGFLNHSGIPLFISSPSNYHGDSLLDGTFDWTNWHTSAEMLLTMKENDYLNVDVTTADPDSVMQRVALDEIGFLFQGNGAVVNVREYNPDVNIGFIPLFHYHEDDERMLIGGERNAIGVAHNTPNEAEALLFLEFLAQPENVIKVSEAQGLPPAIEGVENDLGVLTADYQKWQDTPIQPYFDRVYFPGGMWSVLQVVGASIVSGEFTVEEATQMMEEEYNRLRDEQDEE